MDEYEIRYLDSTGTPTVHIQKAASSANAVALFRLSHTGRIKRVLKRCPREEWQAADERHSVTKAEFQTMVSQLVTLVGESKVAAALRVSIPTVKRWVAGTTAPAVPMREPMRRYFERVFG